VSAVAKSFISEKPETQLYLYTITSPESIILSKLIYNAGMMIFLALLCFGIYSLFLGNVAVDIPLFTISIVLGGVGLSSLFTMISAIASKADNSSVLIAILGFPIILPFLITIIKLSTNAIVGAEWSESYQYLGVLALLNLIVVTLSYILFPYLWKE
jgi:heme exporter protein B